MGISRTARDARYNTKSSRFFSLKFNRATDADLIERLESVDSVNGYIRQLIREDIARSDAAKSFERKETDQ